MKYVVLLCDGMSDYKIPEIDNKTILEYADTSNFDYLAENGRCGLIYTTPKGMYPGSDICNLSVFGYNPKDVYTGRSPIEAASIGVEISEEDFVFRCNIVKLSDDYNVMEDFSAHHIDNKKAKLIIEELNKELRDVGVEFYSGVGYRNIMVVRNRSFDISTTPPHDIMGKPVLDYLPKGEQAGLINDIMAKSREVIKRLNIKNANSIWLWGQGRKPEIKSFEEIYGVKGAVVAAVDLIRGIGVYAGLDIIDVPGATGFIDTNFKGKAEYAIKALDDHDYVFIHIEAPDEAGHMGSVEEKIRAVENINNIVLPVLIEASKKMDMRILISPDHPTPISLRTHVAEPVPAIIYGKDVRPDKNKHYNENIVPSFIFEDGYKVAEYFIKTQNIE
ncbi:cofactor-independent phosphoglycerate mutase [Deferribacterales bacterium Es71-Z0220]|uniref:cofactor-independent phosphoglycerate mutase n=1 Tax=Deferrivibrio essentukiensis TaxID=2880922 RepID=UPI001F617BE8|nr:cofactor-independent phosphoglycerate mutase [Deferrivibrio essentukiensis]MCB4205374.1 cofactor-independent phosphoglycerate mutase [Deferrivibrio essentukiensis]